MYNNMGGNISTTQSGDKSNENIDYLNDFFGKTDKRNMSRLTVLNNSDNSDNALNYNFYTSSSGKRFPYIISSDKPDTRSTSDGISEIEFVVQNDVVSKPIIECFTVAKTSNNHVCLNDCKFCKKYGKGFDMYGGKPDVKTKDIDSQDDSLESSSSSSSSLSTSTSNKKKSKKSTKNNTTDKSSSSESTSDNQDLDIDVTETSEDGIMLTSNVNTSDLYKMQSRIAMNEYSSESEDDHTENVRRALNMINNDNKYSDTSSHILDIFSESTPVARMKNKINKNPKYQ